MSERTYALHLNEEQLIFWTEILVGSYCRALEVQLLAVTRGRYSFAAPVIEAALREQIRSLLREPLQSPLFRKEFNDYFSKHPDEDIRKYGWRWMEEVLVWES